MNQNPRLLAAVLASVALAAVEKSLSRVRPSGVRKTTCPPTHHGDCNCCAAPVAAACAPTADAEPAVQICTCSPWGANQPCVCNKPPKDSPSAEDVATPAGVVDTPSRPRPTVVQNAMFNIKTGEYVISRHVHDYQTLTTSEGRLVGAIDGGDEYLRRLGRWDNQTQLLAGEWRDVSLTTEDSWTDVCAHLLWGSRGKDGQQPLKYKPIAEMDREHIQAVLRTQTVNPLYEAVLTTHLQRLVGVSLSNRKPVPAPWTQLVIRPTPIDVRPGIRLKD